MATRASTLESLSSPHFRRTVQALITVAPLAIAARFEDGLKHCVEASVAGAEVLRRRRIKAKPTACAVMVYRSDDAFALSVGFNDRQLYDRIVGDKPSFDVWKRDVAPQAPADENPLHVVVRAGFGRDSVLLDLTLGQLRETGAPDSEKIPLGIFGVNDEWPSFRVPPWTIEYMASPLAPPDLASANANINRCQAPGLVGDLSDLMDLAINLDLDPVRLHAELMRQQPEAFRGTLGRLAGLSKGCR